MPLMHGRPYAFYDGADDAARWPTGPRRTPESRGRVRNMEQRTKRIWGWIMAAIGTLTLITGWSVASIWGWYQRDILHRRVEVSSFLTSSGFRTLLMGIGVLILVALLLLARRDHREPQAKELAAESMPVESSSDVSPVDYWTPRVLGLAKEARTIPELEAATGLGRDFLEGIANAAMAAGTAIPGQNEQGEPTIQARRIIYDETGRMAGEEILYDNGHQDATMYPKTVEGKADIPPPVVKTDPPDNEVPSG